MTDFVTVEAKTLSKAMKTLATVVEPRNTIPILSCVKLNYSAAGLAVTGTDLDLDVHLAVDEIDGAGEWAICIPANVLEQISSVAGVSPLRIEYRRGANEGLRDTVRISVGDGDAVYDIDNTQPASDWPEISAERGERIERFTNGMLASTLRKVSWAISTEETRYYLNGVCWQSSGNGRRFVATDGHRLALCRYDSEGGDEHSRIIPRKTVAFMMKYFDGLDVEIFTTSKTDHVIDATAPGITLRTKLIDGTFPDIDRVIPKSQAVNHTMKFRRDEILTAIKQAAAVGAKHSSPAVRFHGIDGKLHIERRNADIGTAKVRTSTEWPAEVDAFGFNGRYMIEILSQCQGDVNLGYSDPGAPFLIGDEDESMTRVAMPMRV